MAEEIWLATGTTDVLHFRLPLLAMASSPSHVGLLNMGVLTPSELDLN